MKIMYIYNLLETDLANEVCMYEGQSSKISILRSIKHVTLVSYACPLPCIFLWLCNIQGEARGSKGEANPGPSLNSWSLGHLNYLRGCKYNTYTFFNAAGVPMQRPHISRRGGGEGAISHVFCWMMRSCRCKSARLHVFGIGCPDLAQKSAVTRQAVGLRCMMAEFK